VVVMVVMFREGYRTRRHCKDRRKGDRTNLHRFLLINAGNGICFIEGQRTSPVRVPSPTTSEALRAQAICDAHSVVFCEVLMN
jgi:hypothetical protein